MTQERQQASLSWSSSFRIRAPNAPLTRTETVAESTFCLTCDAKFTNFCKITTRFSAWQRLSGETEEDGEESGSVSLGRQKIQFAKRGTPAMASRSKHDGCRSVIPLCSRHPPFRRVSGHLRAKNRIFPQVLSKHFRIASTFCRQRWVLRYARSEWLLPVLPARNLQTMSALLIPSILPC